MRTCVHVHVFTVGMCVRACAQMQHPQRPEASDLSGAGLIGSCDVAVGLISGPVRTVQALNHWLIALLPDLCLS